MDHPFFLIVVRRHEVARYEALRSSFAQEPVQIIWDRRLGERRRGTSPVRPSERRRADRRQPEPDTWRYLDFVLAPGRSAGPARQSSGFGGPDQPVPGPPEQR